MNTSVLVIINDDKLSSIAIMYIYIYIYNYLTKMTWFSSEKKAINMEDNQKAFYYFIIYIYFYYNYYIIQLLCFELIL